MYLYIFAYLCAGSLFAIADHKRLAEYAQEDFKLWPLMIAATVILWPITAAFVLIRKYERENKELTARQIVSRLSTSDLEILQKKIRNELRKK